MLGAEHGADLHPLPELGPQPKTLAERDGTGNNAETKGELRSMGGRDKGAGPEARLAAGAMAEGVEEEEATGISTPKFPGTGRQLRESSADQTSGDILRRLREARAELDAEVSLQQEANPAASA